MINTKEEYEDSIKRGGELSAEVWKPRCVNCEFFSINSGLCSEYNIIVGDEYAYQLNECGKYVENIPF